MATAEPPIATLEVRQTGKKIMEEGVRYEYAYEWRIRDRNVTRCNLAK